MNIDSILSPLPEGLRTPLLVEYNSITQHYLEGRWTATELSGGKFCEIIYTIIDGMGKGAYATKPSKPSNFPDACKKLENYTKLNRSFQILIPRLLPPLYEIRNNRNVGHVGGDVDSNRMDAQLVIGMTSWILGEIIRCLHNTSISEAQEIVDRITSRKIPLIWTTGEIKRVLVPKMKLRDSILLLAATSAEMIGTDCLFSWTGYGDRKYFSKLLKKLHEEREIELLDSGRNIMLTPLGAKSAESLISKFAQ